MVIMLKSNLFAKHKMKSAPIEGRVSWKPKAQQSRVMKDDDRRWTMDEDEGQGQWTMDEDDERWMRTMNVGDGW